MARITIDENLTPENCGEQGYAWWQDAVFDPDAPEEVNQNLIDLIAQGYRLGKAASAELEKNGGVGIYKNVI